MLKDETVITQESKVVDKQRLDQSNRKVQRPIRRSFVL